MNIAFANVVHINLYTFNCGGCPKWKQLIKIARTLPLEYKLPNRSTVGMKLLDKIYKTNWGDLVWDLLKESTTFGICIFGDGDTVKHSPLFDCLGAGVNNPFTVLDILDCT